MTVRETRFSANTVTTVTRFIITKYQSFLWFGILTIHQTKRFYLTFREHFNHVFGTIFQITFSSLIWRIAQKTRPPGLNTRKKRCLFHLSGFSYICRRYTRNETGRCRMTQQIIFQFQKTGSRSQIKFRKMLRKIGIIFAAPIIVYTSPFPHRLVDENQKNRKLSDE